MARTTQVRTDPWGDRDGQELARELSSMLERNKAIQGQAESLADAFSRFADGLDRQLGPLRVQLAKFEESLGRRRPAPSTSSKSLPAIASDAVVTIQVPHTLTKYLEGVLPQVLSRPFAAKSQRKQGPGYTDIITLRGANEIKAAHAMLYEHRSPSGWYTLTTRVIAELEAQIQQQRPRRR